MAYFDAVIETQRLLLRKFTSDDFQLILYSQY